jgi:DnaJ family protein C protein 28
MPTSLDEIIQRAIAEGQFDNLPGKGKPLQLDENPHEDAEWRTAHRILKNAGFTLPWIETLRAIEDDLESARMGLSRTWAWRFDSLASAQDPDWIESEWLQAIETFQEKISALNKRILNYNLQVPSDRFQRLKINADAEIQAIQTKRLAG